MNIFIRGAAGYLLEFHVFEKQSIVVFEKSGVQFKPNPTKELEH